MIKLINFKDYYESEVRFILSTTVDTLMQAPNRKFIQVEQYVDSQVRIALIVYQKRVLHTVVE